MRFGRAYGIDVHIHWSFWILILFYLFAFSGASGIVDGLVAVGLIVSVFGCVLLHEFGHAAAAARYGIGTQSITLLPIGGVAKLEGMPSQPLHELVIALAGPAVNVLIAMILALPVGLGWKIGWSAPSLGMGSDLLGQLMNINLLLVGFNMLPAFPMDGGRVLRSLLSLKLSKLRATQIAVALGRWMALAFCIWGLFIDWNPMLLLLAGFVFVAGTMELLQVKLRSVTQGTAQSAADGAANWLGQQAAGMGWGQSTARPRHPNSGQIIDAESVRQIR
jgi:Zn-dependent protease